MVITTNGSSGTDFGLFFAQGDGSSSAIRLPTGHHARGATAVDYNRDGNLDLVVETSDDTRNTPFGNLATLDLLTGNGMGGFSYTSSSSFNVSGQISTGVVGLTSGNFFQDTSNPSSNFQIAVPFAALSTDGYYDELKIQFVSIFPSGVWGTGSLLDVGSNTNGDQEHTGNIVAADFNGDGKSDLALSNGTSLDVILSDPASNSLQPIDTYSLSAQQNKIGAGLFVENASAGFVGADTATQGNWPSAYGADGYDVLGAPANLPSYATVTPAGQSSYTWTGPPAVANAPLLAPGSTTSRVSSTWYSTTSFTVDVNLTDSRAHKVSIYALDWGNEGRSERVDVIDPATGNVLDSRTISNFAGGEYLTWTLTGHVQFKFTSLSGPNAVVEGLFFG